MKGIHPRSASLFVLLFDNGAFFLRNSNSTGGANLTFVFGVAGDWPLAGDWNGRPDV